MVKSPGSPAARCPGLVNPRERIPASDLLGELKVGESIEEALQVGSAQRGRFEPVVGSAVQVLGQQPDAVDLAANARGAAAAVLGQLLGRPPLGGPGQPGLGDLGERQRAGVTEDRQIPAVLVLLDTRIGQHAAGVAGERGQHRACPLARGQARLAVVDRGDLVATKRVADRPQHNVGEPQALPNAGLQADQHFHHDQLGQDPQVDLPGLGDAGFPAPPPLLVGFGRVLLGHAPALIVGVAVADRAVGRAGARRYQTCRQRRLGPYSRIAQELLQRDRYVPAAELLGVRFAHDRVAHRRPALAVRDRAALRGNRCGGQVLGGGDVLDAHAQPGQPGETPVADLRGVVVNCSYASFHPAHLPAQQPVLRGQVQHPHRGIPSGLLQQSSIQHLGQVRGRTAEGDPAQHVRELAGFLGGRDRRGQRRGGHRLAPVCSRGLGTASTAARSRDESGCR
jgi:hypothetical protein